MTMTLHDNGPVQLGPLHFRVPPKAALEPCGVCFLYDAGECCEPNVYPSRYEQQFPKIPTFVLVYNDVPCEACLGLASIPLFQQPAGFMHQQRFFSTSLQLPSEPILV